MMNDRSASSDSSQIQGQNVHLSADTAPQNAQGSATDDGRQQSSRLMQGKDEKAAEMGVTIEESRESSQRHWRVPTIMIGALLSGILFAIGHHLFYARYDGALVQGSMGQKWVNRIGTAFAFLVKMFLAIAAGSAYVQRQWLSLGSRGYRIGQVDSLFGILGDATLFVDRVWVSNILLAVLAGVTW